MNHIVIIGFMGSGKTRVGKRLAQDLELPFVEVDKSISKKMGMNINDIFQKFGEPYYRALETLTIKELAGSKERMVVSLGAGLPMQEQNQQLIPALGTVVYIKGSVDTLLKRLEDTNNPMTEEENYQDKIRRMLKQRDPVYQKFADITVRTGTKPFEDLVAEIEEQIKQVSEKNS
ncbi:MAG: shikimate kinase [Blautia sp.]|nr:shikimate kinase [Blautia sp.]